MKFKEWNKEGAAQESEFKVFRMLESRFASEPSLLVSGFYERNICRLAQDTFSCNEGHDGLSEEERSFWSIVCQEDIRSYELEVKLWLEQFHSIWDIGKNQLDDAMKAGILKMSKKQLQKFNIELERAKYHKKDFSEEQMFKMLLDYLKPNSEYDILLVIKRLQIFLHIEIKSLSIGGNCSHEETER